MKVLDIIEEFQRKLDETTNFMMTKKVLVEREELQTLLTNIQTFLPDEMKHAKWIEVEREKILENANLEANQVLDAANKQQNLILEEAKEKFEQTVAESEILKEAQIRADELITNSNNEARAIKMNAYKFSEELLTQTKEALDEKVEALQEDLYSLQEFLQK